MYFTFTNFFHYNLKCQIQKQLEIQVCTINNVYWNSILLLLFYISLPSFDLEVPENAQDLTIFVQNLLEQMVLSCFCNGG